MRDRAAIEADLAVFDSAPSGVAVPAGVRLAGDVPALLAAVTRVRELHYQYRAAHLNDYDICPECSRADPMVGVPWPCPTRRALDGEQR